MTRTIIAMLLAPTISGSAHAYKKGEGSTGKEFYAPMTITCEYFIDTHSRTELTGERDMSGPSDAHLLMGYISGYITAYNQFTDNNKTNILGSMTLNDTFRWLASWCRDNPSKTFFGGFDGLTGSLEK